MEKYSNIYFMVSFIVVMSRVENLSGLGMITKITLENRWVAETVVYTEILDFKITSTTYFSLSVGWIFSSLNRKWNFK